MAARFLPLIFLIWAVSCGPAGAQQAVDVERSGTLANVRVAKPALAFGARADLTFNLEYLVRVTSLMGSPIVNCGLRVRDLRGSAEFDLSGERQKVQITDENSADVTVLHLGFLLHTYNFLLTDPSVRTLSVRCQPGVIARDDSQPFNVPANPGLDRFFCANAAVPEMDFRNDLPDMLGPDWCSDLGGTFVPAEEARALFRKGIMDDISDWGGFSPRVVALGIGIGEVIGNARQRLAELSQEADPEPDTNGRPDPSTILARMAAERARIAQEATTDIRQHAAVETDQSGGNADLVSARAQAQQARDQALGECRTNRPVATAAASSRTADAARAGALERCQAQAPRRLWADYVLCSDPRVGISYHGYCLPDGQEYTARVIQANRDYEHWLRTNTCEADADNYRAEFVSRSGPEAQARNRHALAEWEASAIECEASVNSAYERAIADAETGALRARSLRRMINPE